MKWSVLGVAGAAGAGSIPVLAFLAIAGAGMVFPQSVSDYIIRGVYLQYCLSCPAFPDSGNRKR
jgi:hypothetical protein